MTTCEKGDLIVVQLTFDKFGAKSIISAKEGSGKTCLHHAVGDEDPTGYKKVTFLLENGAELDPKDNAGETPLRESIR